MMTNRTKLPLTVAPIPGESATSLASRLAWRNGAPRLITFCTDVGIDHRALTNGDAAEIERVATLSGHNPEQLLFWTPRHVSPGWFQLGHERIKFTAFSRTQTRACPACLLESGARGDPARTGHPGFWQLSSIRSCPRHGCLLVPMPTAPSNKDVFDFARIAERYSCAKPTPATGADPALQNYLVGRICEGTQKSWIDRLPFHVAAQTAENLGVLLTHAPDARRSDIDNRLWLAAGAAGYRVLMEGPDALNAALADMKRGHVNDAGRYRTRYRFFFEWLRNRDDDPDFDVIRDLVRDFIWRSFPVAKGALVLGKECPRQYVHSLSTAVTATGITKRQLGRRLCAMGLAKRGGGETVFDIHDYLPVDVIDSIKAEFSSLMSATEASAYLGIKPFLLTKLTRPDLIPPFLQEENALPLYQTHALDGFMERLEALREPGAPADGWVEIAKAAHRIKITTEHATSLILLHKLPLRCPRSEISGLRDLLVDPSMIREAISLPDWGAVHPARAAALLGVKIQTVAMLLEKGYLDRVPVERPKPARPVFYVCPSSIEVFSSGYLSARDLPRRRDKLSELFLTGDVPEDFALDLGPKAEPIYRRDITAFL